MELEAALQRGPNYWRTSTIYLDFEHYNYADIALPRTLWLQGHPAQVSKRARQSVKDAASMGHPVPLSRALVWAVSVFLWAGDLQSADEHTDWLISYAESHSLGPYLAVGRGYKVRRPSTGESQKAGLRSCRVVWRCSTPRVTSCLPRRSTSPSFRDLQRLDRSPKAWRRPTRRSDWSRQTATSVKCRSYYV